MNKIIIIIIIIIIVLLLLRNKENYIVVSNKKTCNRCSDYDSDIYSCGDCSNCGYCITKSGKSYCVNGNEKGSITRDDCVEWHFKKPTENVYYTYPDIYTYPDTYAYPYTYPYVYYGNRNRTYDYRPIHRYNKYKRPYRSGKK